MVRSEPPTAELWGTDATPAPNGYTWTIYYRNVEGNLPQLVPDAARNTSYSDAARLQVSVSSKSRSEWRETLALKGQARCEFKPKIGTGTDVGLERAVSEPSELNNSQCAVGRFPAAVTRVLILA